MSKKNKSIKNRGGNEMKKLELTVVTTSEGVYLSSVERTDDELSGEGFLNKKYDLINIDIMTLNEMDEIINLDDCEVLK
jgi:hypothetical protein